MVRVMNYKDAFYWTAFLLLLVIGIGSYSLFQINKTLDKIKEQMVNDQITKYVQAGWMPLPGYDKTKKSKKKKLKKK